MKNAILLLFMFLAAGCHSDGRSSSAPTASVTPAQTTPADDSTCLYGYQVCVGDHIWQNYASDSAFDRTVVEVVPAGSLTKEEQARVAAQPPDQRQYYIEGLIRENSKAGSRMVFLAMPDTLLGELMTETSEFSSLYRAKGCDADKQVCVGDQYEVLAYDHLDSHRLLGFRLRDKGFDVQGKYLVDRFVPENNEWSKIHVDDFIRVTKSGCTKIPPLAHDFCVGDAFTQLTLDRGASVALELQVFALTVSRASETASIVINQHGTVSIYKPSAQPFGIYVPQGCVPGVPDICFPLKENDNFVQVLPLQDVDGGTGANDQPPIFELRGIRLPDSPAKDLDVAYGLDHYLNDIENISSDFISESFFRTRGCGTSAKVCVGQTVHLVHPETASEMEVTGYNNSGDLILGDVTVNGKKLGRIMPVKAINL